jgi:hypothetical protein
MEPTTTPTSSERMSPKRFSVTTTSKRLGDWIISKLMAST